MPALEMAQQPVSCYGSHCIVQEIAPHEGGPQQDPASCKASGPGQRVPLAELQHLHPTSAEEYSQGVLPGR